MFDPQPPLNDRELRIIRGMLDEYEFNRRRRQGLFHMFGTWERLVVVLFTAAPTIDIILRLTGH